MHLARTRSRVLANLRPSPVTSGQRSRYSSKLWTPIRSILDRFSEPRGESGWTDVLMPGGAWREDRRIPDPKAIYGVRCDRPTPRIHREMHADYLRRILAKDTDTDTSKD